MNERKMRMRAKCLDMAREIVCSNREPQYGSPEDNFKVIADMWSGYLQEIKLDSVDVAMMLGMLKMARVRTGVFKEDSFVDLAGYAACGYEVAKKREEAIAEDDRYPQITIDEALLNNGL